MHAPRARGNLGEECRVPGRNAGYGGARGPQQELNSRGRALGPDPGLKGWEESGRGCARGASDVFVVRVSANVPQDHVKNEQDSEKEQSHEDGLDHGGNQQLHALA